MIKNIICIGGASIDHKLKSLAPLINGTSNPVSSTTTYGGVARNVAENLAHWTKGVYLQCVVGNDDAGIHLLNYMQQLGINIKTSLALKNQTTSNYYAILTEYNELSIAFADMDIYQHIPESKFIETWNDWNENSIVFIDANLPQQIIEHAIEHTKNKNIKLCIDPVSVHKSQRLPLSLKNIYLIKPNQLEASALTNVTINSVDDCFKAGRILLERGVENVVISLGNSGHVIVNAQLQEHIKTVEFSEIHDVNGAGDAFIAGILFGLQQNANIIHACELGAAAAAFTLHSHKTVAEDITVNNLLAFIHNQKKLSQENEDATIL